MRSFDLVACGEVRGIGAQPKRGLFHVVEGGQAARKIFAIDDALGKSVDRAETELPRKRFDPGADQPLVARAQRGEAIAYDHPVGQAAIDQPALACAPREPFRHSG